MLEVTSASPWLPEAIQWFGILLVSCRFRWPLVIWELTTQEVNNSKYHLHSLPSTLVVSRPSLLVTSCAALQKRRAQKRSSKNLSRRVNKKKASLMDKKLKSKLATFLKQNC